MIWFFIMDNTFAALLRAYMREHRLTQMQLADKIGMQQSQVSNWLNDKSLPCYHSLIALCEKLGVNPSDML